jgi:hypothetical protein
MLPETPTGDRPVSLHDAAARHGRYLRASRIVSRESAKGRASRQHQQLRPHRPPSGADARQARARRGSAALQHRAPCWSGSNPHTTRALRRRAQRVESPPWASIMCGCNRAEGRGADPARRTIHRIAHPPAARRRKAPGKGRDQTSVEDPECGG